MAINLKPRFQGAKNVKPKICECCGEIFMPYRNYQKFCSKEACQKERLYLSHKKQPPKKKKDNVLTKPNTLVEDAWSAKQLGISYGQYKARQLFEMI